MIAKLSLKLKSIQKSESKEKPAYDSEKLSNATVRHNFNIQLTNRFESLTLGFNNRGSVESFWNTLKEAFNHTALETLGHKKKTQRWMVIR